MYDCYRYIVVNNENAGTRREQSAAGTAGIIIYKIYTYYMRGRKSFGIAADSMYSMCVQGVLGK